MPDRSATPPEPIDALVVGGGPAGLSAATWLGRYRRRTLVVDAGQPRNAAVEEVHGLLGQDPVPPAQLRDRAVTDLGRYPHVTVHAGRVRSLETTGDGFVADLDDGTTVSARRVVLATGVRDAAPDLEGFAEHYGADVFHCPTCEGFEARERDVVVLGWAPHVPPFATELLDWARSVTVLTLAAAGISGDQRRRLADRGIGVVDQRATRLSGTRGALDGVVLDDGRVLPATMAFFSIDHTPTVELATPLGCELTPEGLVAVDADGRTSVTGVYAAGDLTPGLQLVAVAIAKGTTAGVACARSFHGQETTDVSPSPAPEPGELAP